VIVDISRPLQRCDGRAPNVRWTPRVAMPAFKSLAVSHFVDQQLVPRDRDRGGFYARGSADLLAEMACLRHVPQTRRPICDESRLRKLGDP
jgi:hypothetical protein